MYNRERPEGAITLVEFLEMVCVSQIRPVMFYRASTQFGVTEVVLDKASIKTEGDDHLQSDYTYIGCQTSPVSRSPFSLLDANLIENGYNDWFPFADKERAEAYAKNI